MASLTYFTGLRYGGFEDLDLGVNPTDNSVYVSTPTIEKLLGYDPKRGSRKIGSKSFKAFVGKPLAGSKTYDAIDVTGRKNKISFYPFDTLLKLVYWEAFEGKGKHQDNARKLLMAGFADSFSSLMLDQCGIQLTRAQRQQTVDFYLGSYHGFYDWIRDTYTALYGTSPKLEYYRKIAIEMNRHLFGRDHFNKDRLTNADNQQLRLLENIQMGFMRSRWKDVPLERSIDPATIILEFLKQYPRHN